MEVTGKARRIRLLLIAAAFLARRADAPLDNLPTTDVTIRAIGQRLGRSCSERELTAIATRGDPAPKLLPPSEQPSRADTCVSRSIARFWSKSPFPPARYRSGSPTRAFERTDLVLENPDTSWRVFRKSVSRRELIGLGVNGLDRTPLAHYVVFVEAEPRTGSATTNPS